MSDETEETKDKKISVKHMIGLLVLAGGVGGAPNVAGMVVSDDSQAIMQADIKNINLTTTAILTAQSGLDAKVTAVEDRVDNHDEILHKHDDRIRQIETKTGP